MHRCLPLLSLLLPLSAAAQTPCTRVAGVVLDSTGALIPGATVTLDAKTTRTSGADGRFTFPCVNPGKHDLAASIAGFADYTVHVTAPHAADLSFRLVPSTEASISVDADLDMQVPAPGGSNGLVVSGKQLQALADDPDDLQRQIQQLGAMSGGSPGNTHISVDGFQDDSKLPPKDSIAYIQVTPDLFSAEYREPPFGGARVEVFTKPGAKTYHGSLFGTNSSSWMNARDPFATSTGKIGKQRYGFDFSGPITRKGSSFSLSFEHRDIDELAVVNAFDLNGNNIIDNVPQPQALSIAQARADWQITPKNFAFMTYSVNTTNEQNAGVGGLNLRETGYSDSNFDQTVRASDVATISAKFMHEARMQFEWVHDTIAPNSTGPSQQLSGYFVRGGSVLGNTRQYRASLEADEDVVLTPNNHTIKAGYTLFWKTRDSLLLNNFNGTNIYIDPAHYLAHQPQQFSQVTGNPEVRSAQLRFSAFFQDNQKLRDNLTFSYGLRYDLQAGFGTYNQFSPRMGFAWSPDKKKRWQLSTHFGVFTDQYGMDTVEEVNREDGHDRITSLFETPAGSSTLSATPIFSLRTRGPNTNPGVYVLGEVSASRDLPWGFNVNAQEVLARFLTYDRTININQPLNGDPYGPRPFGPNVNILQVTNNGAGQGHGEFFGLSNFKHKQGGFFLGALHLNLRDNSNDHATFQSQSAYSDAGEQAPRDDQPMWMVFTNANVTLPLKLSLSLNGMAGGDQPFNITTGIDNNGDGTFNDRPVFAAPGAAPGLQSDGKTMVYATPFGLLTDNVQLVNGAPLRPTARDLGRLPWSFHLDANIQRAWVITRNAKADHQQTITANIRSANFLNHTNVTSEGSILGAPNFLIPQAADAARRVEAGLRYSF